MKKGILLGLLSFVAGVVTGIALQIEVEMAHTYTAPRASVTAPEGP
jgi:hypothetical protein